MEILVIKTTSDVAKGKKEPKKGILNWRYCSRVAIYENEVVDSESLWWHQRTKKRKWGTQV